MRTMLTAVLASAALAGVLLFSGASRAEHRALTDDDLAYPGTIAVADGHGKVDVRVIYLAQDACWKIVSARPGLPDARIDQPTDRHLYITVSIQKTGEACAAKHTPLDTRLVAQAAAGMNAELLPRFNTTFGRAVRTEEGLRTATFHARSSLRFAFETEHAAS